MHKHIGLNLTFLALLALAGLSPAPWTTAQEQDAKTRLGAAMAAVGGLDSLAFNLTMTSRVKKGDDSESKESVIQGDMLLRGKTDVYLHLKTGQEEVQIISNGQVHYLYMPIEKKYRKLDSKLERNKLMAVVNGGIFEAASTWLADFLNNNAELIDGASAVNLTGEETLVGTPCEVYKLEYSAFDALVFVAKTNPPALVRVEIDLSKSISAAAHGGKSITASVTSDLTQWQANAPAPAERFTFAPPEGVEEIKDTDNNASAGAAVGEDAPGFTLPLLKGGEVALASHKGKDVVMLDFWATWCGPCRMAMPVVDKVMREFAGKGVVLYAINQGETPEKINTFLDQQKLAVNVALDRTHEASMAYGANSIPHMVIIGRDGRIKSIHKGYSPELEKELRDELTKINAETAAPADPAATQAAPTADPAATTAPQ